MIGVLCFFTLISFSSPFSTKRLPSTVSTHEVTQTKPTASANNTEIVTTAENATTIANTKLENATLPATFTKLVSVKNQDSTTTIHVAKLVIATNWTSIEMKPLITTSTSPKPTTVAQPTKFNNITMSDLENGPPWGLFIAWWSNDLATVTLEQEMGLVKTGDELSSQSKYISNFKFSTVAYPGGISLY